MILESFSRFPNVLEERRVEKFGRSRKMREFSAETHLPGPRSPSDDTFRSETHRKDIEAVPDEFRSHKLRVCGRVFRILDPG